MDSIHRHHLTVQSAYVWLYGFESGENISISLAEEIGVSAKTESTNVRIKRHEPNEINIAILSMFTRYNQGVHLKGFSSKIV